MNIQLKILDILKNNEHFKNNSELVEYRDNGPTYAYDGDAAIDLRACLDYPVDLWPWESLKFRTGLSFWIGSGTNGFNIDGNHATVAGIIVPRSGLGSNQGIVIGNLVGVCDSQYQGEVIVSLFNRTDDKYTVNPGDKIAQMMFVPIMKPSITLVDDHGLTTDRGANGFNSSGTI